MAEPKIDGEELVTVQDVMERLSIAESTAWLFIKRHDLPRYRLPGRGKTVFFRWSDVQDAYRTPVQVGGTKKVEALAA